MVNFSRSHSTIIIALLGIVTLIEGNSVELAQFAKDKLIQEIFKLNLNKNINPCHDFYEHTCGSFSNYGKYTHKGYELYDIVTTFNNYFGTEWELNETELKAKKFYISCKGERNTHQLRQLDLYRSVGSWPVLDTRWSSLRIFNWTRSIAELRRIGIKIFIHESVSVINNQKKIVIEPDRKDSPFDKSTYIKYHNLMQENGASEDRIRRDLNEIKKFCEIRDKIIREHKDEAKNEIDITYKELKEKYTNFNWDEYFGVILGRNLSDNNILVINSENELEKLLELYAQTDRRLVANYMWARFLGDADTTCERLVKKYFSSLYTKFLYCPLFNVPNLLEIFRKSEAAFNTYLKESKWITDPEYGSQLSKEMQQWVLYITLKLEDEFADLKLDDYNNFYKNLLIAGMHKTYNEHKDIYQGLNIYGLRDYNLNEFYDLMRESFYNKELPMSANFARLGTMYASAAIEVTNSSDIWRSEKYSILYRNISDCLSKQTFIRKTKPVDPNSRDAVFYSFADPVTWAINLSGSVRAAYQAYLDWLKYNEAYDKAEEEVLLEHDLNSRKYFFVSFASILCTNEKYLKAAVNSVLKNMPEFGEAYSCAPGSRMNVKDRCEIW